DLYTYEAPHIPRWKHPALGSDVPVSVCGCVRGKSAIVRHDPDKSGLVIYSHGVVRYDHGLHVRGPP
ncbi:hypothetical protein, partial [Hyphomonas jannaschiana]|uniref:hypothetical protein n=1 Tax=Hyphomonas jannaschiana TaxID=86 RepID=UPI0019D6CF18